MHRVFSTLVEPKGSGAKHIADEMSAVKLKKSAELAARAGEHELAVELLMLWQAKATEVEKGAGAPAAEGSEMVFESRVRRRRGDGDVRPSDGTVADQLLAIAESLLDDGLPLPWPATPVAIASQQAPHGQCFGQFGYIELPKLSEKLVAHVQKNEAFAPGQKVLHWQPDFQRWDAGRIRRKVDGGDGGPPKYDIVTWKDRAAVERKALLAPDAAGLSAALRRAAQLHDVQVVDTMLKAGVSLYTCDDSANTALIRSHHGAQAFGPQRALGSDGRSLQPRSRTALLPPAAMAVPPAVSREAGKAATCEQG